MFIACDKLEVECSSVLTWCCIQCNVGYPPQQQPLMTQQNYPAPPPGSYPTQPQPAMPLPSSYPTQQLPTQSADPNAPPNYASGKSS